MRDATQPLQVGLVQISETYKGLHYLPLAIGYMQAYAQYHAPDPGRYRFLPMVFSHLSVDEAARQLAGADVVGFSAYIWNMERSLRIAAALKQAKPNTLIIFGGPHTPAQAEPFLRDHPQVDVCVAGEGEAVFLQLLESYPGRDWSAIPSISYLSPAGKYIINPKAPRLKELDLIPSPYLSGVYQSLLQTHLDINWMACWETNRGCPFSCSFCDWGSSATGTKVHSFSMERLDQELEWFARYRIAAVFCCDANFGIFRRDLDIAHRVAESKQRSGYPVEFHQQTAKNVPARSFEIHQILAGAGVMAEATLSLQSIDPETLRSVRRENISLKAYETLQKSFLKEGLLTYTDVIIALPGETYASYANGVSTMIASGQHSRMQFYNAMILPNSEMGDPAYQARFGIETMRIPFSEHGKPRDGIHEYKELIVATNAMPRTDWVQARALAWVTGFLYYGYKLLQIPLVVLHEVAGIPYRDSLEVFLGDQLFSPILAEIRAFFRDQARAIQTGNGTEFCQADRLPGLNLPDTLYFPPDKFMTLKLCLTDRLDSFYHESHAALQHFLEQRRAPLPPQLLQESLALNRALFLLGIQDEAARFGIPLPTDNLALRQSFNLDEFFQGALTDQRVPLEPRPRLYYKNWAGPPYVLAHQ